VHLTKRERSLLGVRMTATQRVSVKRIHGLSRTTATLFRDPADDIDQTGKGKFAGKCNRTACDHRGEGIVWWNRSTQFYYCRDCRDAIDEWIDKDHGPCFHKHPHTADGVPHPDDDN
jgi:hypothetical protein